MIWYQEVASLPHSGLINESHSIGSAALQLMLKPCNNFRITLLHPFDIALNPIDSLLGGACNAAARQLLFFKELLKLDKYLRYLRLDCLDN